MRKELIYAGIVSYNPDIDRLKQNIDAIIPQVTEVVIFDNGSNNINQILDITGSKIKVLRNEENMGIAFALNCLMKYGEKKYQWMLSLDQDSVCEKDYVRKVMPYFSNIDNIGIVAPVVVDCNIGIVGHNPKEKYTYVKTCITSGAFVKVSVWQQIRGYDESMFIDSVDFEFCYRVRKAGYKIIQVRDVQLQHAIGTSRKYKLLFWNINVYGHSVFRKYYIARNNVYYPLKHHLWLHFIRGNIRNLKLLVIIVLYESEKKDKVISVFRGWRDAFKKGCKYED